MTEEELIEFLMAFLPESLEGWLAWAMLVSAVLSYVLPTPPDDAHPALRMGHRFICILGCGATKLRAAGKLAGALRRKKEGQ